MKKLIYIGLLLLVGYSIYARDVFTAYEDSQNFKNKIINNGDINMLKSIINFQSLISFSKDELRLLRNMIYAKYNYSFKSNELRNYFSKFKWYEGIKTNVDESLTELDKINIRFIQEIELNFPTGNEIDKKLIGIWRFAGGVPAAGYIWGDYIRIYQNGIFEYLFRDSRTDKYGLWTSKNLVQTNINIEYISISDINYNDDRKEEEIVIYDQIWWHLGFENADQRIEWEEVFNW
ncbi:hypothetical protein AGMMS49579_16570 [Spirochaetia bacterium]|nr:hypothetical protein AGMMS49579_16570 [Spirochaetia bacterium]